MSELTGHETADQTALGPVPTGTLAARDRSAARRRRAALVAGAALVVGVVGVGASAVMRDYGRREQLTTQPGKPTFVEVNCTTTGTEVDGDVVVASPDGVHLRVRNTSGVAAYANWSVPRKGFGGGDPAPVEPTDQALVVPPGPLAVQCGRDQNRTMDPAVSITVVDPQEHYRPFDISAELGCSPGLIVDWVRGGSGATREAALADLAALIEKDLSFRDVSAYPEQRDRMYLAFEGNRGFGVGAARLEGDHYTAVIDSVCAGVTSNT